MILVGFIACFVVILVLAIAWFDAECRCDALLKMAREDIPEFDVAPEDHA